MGVTLAAATALLTGCATQPAYQRADLKAASGWANGVAAPSTAVGAQSDAWWTLLYDDAVNGLVEAALLDNPTLGQAVARMDEARAAARISEAQRLPQVALGGSATRARTAGAPGSGGDTMMESSATLGPSLSWELDLWGRLTHIAVAARDRLDARTADATAARLSLTSRIATAVLALRACDFSLAVRDRDIASREIELELMRERLAHGNVALVDAANAETNLAIARTDRISQHETCVRLIDELVALSGRSASAVRTLVVTRTGSAISSAETNRSSAAAAVSDNDAGTLIPAPAPLAPALPATVLLGHPVVVAAEREAAARWSEIGVARAERLPQLNLTALLTGNWIRTFGSTVNFDTWSAGVELTAPVLDQGAGAARVHGAQARYREASEALREAVRTAVRDVEDALAGQQSAEQRVVTSQRAVAAGRITLRANEARWRAGAISLFELENSRRQFNSAQESAIAAARDRAQAWVALILAVGGPAGLQPAAATAPAPSPIPLATANNGYE